MQNQKIHQTFKPTGKPQIGPQHEHLDEFVGAWRLKQKDGLTTANVPKEISGEEVYAWMEGNYFLEYRFDRLFDGKRHTGVGVIGYNETTHKYFANFYDNLGYAREYDVELDFGIMKLFGKWERATIAVSRDHQLMDVHWEHSRDGITWASLCDIEGVLVSELTPLVPH